jgi:hypothetical protein
VGLGDRDQDRMTLGKGAMGNRVEGNQAKAQQGG